MPKHVTYRERVQTRGWNMRFLLDRERGRRWLRRHVRREKVGQQDRPWWWLMANR